MREVGKPLNERDGYLVNGQTLSAAKKIIYDRSRKRPVRAYFSWLILGLLGLHRFYVDWSWSGLTMLLLFMMGILLYFTIIGQVLIGAVVVWWLIDAFRLPKIIKIENKKLVKSLSH